MDSPPFFSHPPTHPPPPSPLASPFAWRRSRVTFHDNPNGELVCGLIFPGSAALYSVTQPFLVSSRNAPPHRTKMRERGVAWRKKERLCSRVAVLRYQLKYWISLRWKVRTSVHRHRSPYVFFRWSFVLGQRQWRQIPCRPTHPRGWGPVHSERGLDAINTRG